MSSETFFWTPTANNYGPNYDGDLNGFQNHSTGFNTLDNFGNEYSANSASNLFEPAPFSGGGDEFEDEPPFLEELEIYPERIAQKMLAVLNPFRGHSVTDDAEYLTKDSDLAGPIFFYLLLGFSVFVAGGKAHFGYIYGISVVSSLMMYCLLTLMTSQSVFTLTTVASVLGYSLIPIIPLSFFGIFISFRGLIGAILAIFVVIWSSISASRLFVAISGDKEQQPLIAYPCAVVSAVYVLLVVF